MGTRWDTRLHGNRLSLLVPNPFSEVEEVLDRGCVHFRQPVLRGTPCPLMKGPKSPELLPAQVGEIPP